MVRPKTDHIEIHIYFTGESAPVARELKDNGIISQICRDAVLKYKEENMNVAEIDRELERIKQEDLEKEERRQKLIIRRKQLEKAGQIEAMNKKQQTQLLKEIKEKTGVDGELLEKLQKCVRPNMSTAREMGKNYNIGVKQVCRAWDILHKAGGVLV